MYFVFHSDWHNYFITFLFYYILNKILSTTDINKNIMIIISHHSMMNDHHNWLAYIQSGHQCCVLILHNYFYDMLFTYIKLVYLHVLCSNTCASIGIFFYKCFKMVMFYKGFVCHPTHIITKNTYFGGLKSRELFFILSIIYAKLYFKTTEYRTFFLTIFLFNSITIWRFFESLLTIYYKATHIIYACYKAGL